MEILGYLGTIITGISLGLIGGGGSILMVPILVYLFSMTPALATAYSLFVVGAASALGAYRYAVQGLIDYRIAGLFAAPAFVGVFVSRRWIVPSLPDTIFQMENFVLTRDSLIMVVFALVMLAASAAMIRKQEGPEAEGEQEASHQRPTMDRRRYPLIIAEGLGVGALTGFVGAGGGFLIIPALVILAKMPMKVAVGTSLAIIAVKSLIGFLGDLAANQAIEWPFLLIITSLAGAGILGGNQLSRYISGKKLQPIFGWFLIIMGSVILLQAW